MRESRRIVHGARKECDEKRERYERGGERELYLNDARLLIGSIERCFQSLREGRIELPASRDNKLARSLID